MSDHDAPGTVLQVGMRCLFKTATADKLWHRNGQVCDIVGKGVTCDWRIRFDDGEVVPVFASELTPLPSASSGATTEMEVES